MMFSIGDLEYIMSRFSQSGDWYSVGGSSSHFDEMSRLVKHVDSEDQLGTPCFQQMYYESTKLNFPKVLAICTKSVLQFNSHRIVFVLERRFMNYLKVKSVVGFLTLIRYNKFEVVASEVIEKHFVFVIEFYGNNEYVNSLQGVVAHYNEVDSLRLVLENSQVNGIPFHIIDDGSSPDQLADLAEFVKNSNNRLTLSKLDFTENFQWARMLQEIDDYQSESNSDVILRVDSDEYLMSPFKKMSLVQFVNWSINNGWDVIDATVVNLKSRKGQFSGFEDATHFEISSISGHTHVHRVWRNLNKSVDLASRGGHMVNNLESKMSPYNLILLHAPLRNSIQIREKIMDRIDRGKNERVNLGWHTHYSADVNVAIQQVKPSPDSIDISHIRNKKSRSLMMFKLNLRK
jgi:hypothetical protein